MKEKEIYVIYTLKNDEDMPVKMNCACSDENVAKTAFKQYCTQALEDMKELYDQTPEEEIETWSCETEYTAYNHLTETAYVVYMEKIELI